MRTLAAIRDVAGDAPVTLLAVPRYHDEASSAAFDGWLGDRVRRGDELALHGCTHRDDGTPRAGSTACVAAATRAARASSGRSRAQDALARIDVGIEWFAKNGWPLSGFVAPAWLLGPGAREALVERPFEYTATLRQLVHLPDQTPVTSQSVVYSTSNAWRRASSLAWNAVVAIAERDNRLLRMELHPRDADFAAVQALVAEDPREGAAARKPATVAEFMRRARPGGARCGPRRCATTGAPRAPPSATSARAG